MKKKILEQLKTKFLGVSDTILDRIADKLAKTVTSEDGIEEAVDAVSFQQVLDSYGDSRATQATQTAVANYERKYGLKDGKPKTAENTEPKPNPTGTTEVTPKGGETPVDKKSGEEQPPAWAQALIASNEQLAQQVATLQAERVGTTRKARLAEALKDAPERIRTRYSKDFERITFKDDDDFNSWIDEITPEIAEIAKEVGTRGAVVKTPKGGSAAPAEGKVSPAVQARIDERAKAEAATPAIAGLPTQATINNK